MEVTGGFIKTTTAHYVMAQKLKKGEILQQKRLKEEFVRCMMEEV